MHYDTVSILVNLDSVVQLIIFIGIQGAGKSTFYQQNFCDTHIRLNGDMLKTKHREKLLFEACLQSKTATVIDKTNPSKDSRADYIRQAQQHRFTVIAYYFDVPFVDALQRNNRRTGKSKVPEVGVKATAKQLEKPCFSEGFDKIYHVSVTDDFHISEQIKE